MSRFAAALLLIALTGCPGAFRDAAAQAVPREYQVKAAFVYQFSRFVEWPDEAPADALRICIAGQDVFGGVLHQTVSGEAANGRPLEARVILAPEPGCEILYIPDRGSATVYLRAARGAPILTVGESPTFLEQGGIIRLFIDGTNVRFELNLDAAQSAGLRISTRLIQLARRVVPAGTAGRGEE